MPFSRYRGEKHLTATEDSSAATPGFHFEPINSEAGNGAQAIHAAAEEGHAQAVRALVAAGADVDSLSMGVAPLHLACQYDRLDVLQGTMTVSLTDCQRLSWRSHDRICSCTEVILQF